VASGPAVAASIGRLSNGMPCCERNPFASAQLGHPSRLYSTTSAIVRPSLDSASCSRAR